MKAPIECSIVSLYIPFKNINDANILEGITGLLSQLSSPVILLGDLNASHHSWGNKYNSNRGNILQEVFYHHNITPIPNSEITRICPNRGTGNTLEHCVMPCSMLSNFNLEIVPDGHGSDHFPLLIYSDMHVHNPSTKTRWKLGEADWDLSQMNLTQLIPEGYTPNTE